MVVIDHQAVGVADPVEVLDHRAEDAQERMTVFVVLLNRLATITAGGEVVERAGKFDP